MVEVSEIFYGFCRQFSSLGLTSAPTPSIWKYRLYYFFENLARMLGYEVITEDIFTKEDGFKSLVGKKIGMTWHTPDMSKYIIALEYAKTNKIDNNIKKLAAIEGLRILVMFQFDFTDEEIIDKIKEEDEKYGESEDPFLILILPNEFKKSDPFEKLTAILLNSKGKRCESGSAEAYIGMDGVCSFKNINWINNIPK